MIRRASCLLALLSIGLTGCASFSDDGGLDLVSSHTRDRTGHALPPARTEAQREAGRQRTLALLAEPIDGERAVELALLNNAQLRARLARVGIAEAELVAAGRLRNPVFSFGRLSAGAMVEIDRGLMFDVLGLLTLPMASRAAEARFDAARLEAAAEAVALATRARRDWVSAVAAAERLRYLADVKAAADAASELAEGMVVAGNFSRLEQMREQVFYADATADLAQASQAAVVARERLLRTLGVEAADPALPTVRLPARLPDLPATPLAPAALEQFAITRRLDVLAARQATAATARTLGLTRTTGLVNVLEAGYQNRSESGSPRANGFEIALNLPLFDFGGARAHDAEARYMASVHEATAVALEARSEVRERFSAYRSAWDLARHYRDEIVPLRRQISEENLRRYNGMLISVFELLADARVQIASADSYISSLRDFWLAHNELEAALAARLPRP